MTLKPLLALVASALVAIAAQAAAPSTTATAAPAGSTGLCKDGSYSNAADKKGACRGHKGVKDWYATAGTLPPSAAALSSAVAATPIRPAAVAAGGGPGKVWVNTTSKVYHCPTDPWYGKTKAGEYLSEADAKAQGFHAEHGKVCAP